MSKPRPGSKTGAKASGGGTVTAYPPAGNHLFDNEMNSLPDVQPAPTPTGGGRSRTPKHKPSAASASASAAAAAAANTTPLAMAGMAMMANAGGAGDPNALLFNPYMMNPAAFNPLLAMPPPLPNGMNGMAGMPMMPFNPIGNGGADMFGNPMMPVMSAADFNSMNLMMQQLANGGAPQPAAAPAPTPKSITKPIIKSPATKHSPAVANATAGSAAAAAGKRANSVSSPTTGVTSAGAAAAVAESKRPASVTRTNSSKNLNSATPINGSHDSPNGGVTYTSNIPAPAVNGAWLADNGYYFNSAKPQTPIPMGPAGGGMYGASSRPPLLGGSPGTPGGSSMMLPPRSPQSGAGSAAAYALSPPPPASNVQKNEHVRVIVRIRPVLKHETASGSLAAVFRTSESSLQIDLPTLSEPASASLVSTGVSSSNPKVSTPSRASRSSHSRSRSAHPTLHNDSSSSTSSAAASTSAMPGASNRAYKFDCVFDDASDQAAVFEGSGIKKLVELASEGYAATVFAYGQTGSGKTYTMSGMEERIASAGGFHNPTTDGLIPRSLQHVFTLIKQQQQNGMKYTVKASYLEIYNEQVFDLLNPDGKTLNLRLSPGQKNFFVENLVVVECANVEDLMAVGHEGHKNRTVGSHALNKDSSRSHSIMTVYIESKSESSGGAPAAVERKASRAGTGGGRHHRDWNDAMDEADEIIRVGKLSFVDLAGSENLKQSKNIGQTSIKETGNINKSLFTLGAVISDLGDIATGKKPKSYHVPYRNSLLTKLLMDSLGGTGLTMMIACVSPAAMHIEETSRTLNYSSRALNIVNEPVVRVNPNERLILEFREEIRRLNKENAILKALLDSSKISYSQTLSRNGPYPFLLASPRGGAAGGGAGAPMRLADVAAATAGSAGPVPLGRKQLSNRNLLAGTSRADSDDATAGGSPAAGVASAASVDAVMRENEKLRARLETLEKIFVATTTRDDSALWAIAPATNTPTTATTSSAAPLATAASSTPSATRPASAIKTTPASVMSPTPPVPAPLPVPATPHTPPPLTMTTSPTSATASHTPAATAAGGASTATSTSSLASGVTSPPAPGSVPHANHTPTAVGGGTPVTRSMPIVRLKTADHSAIGVGVMAAASAAGSANASVEATNSVLAARDEALHLRTHNSHLREQNTELLKRLAALEKAAGNTTAGATTTGTASPNADELNAASSVGSPAPSAIPRPMSGRRAGKPGVTPASPLPSAPFTTPP